MNRQDLKNAVDAAAWQWLDEGDRDQDELDQYDLWEELSYPMNRDRNLPNELPWVKGSVEDYNLADLKIMRAFNYIEERDFPGFEDFFLLVIDNLIPFASERLARELHSAMDSQGLTSAVSAFAESFANRQSSLKELKDTRARMKIVDEDDTVAVILDLGNKMEQRRVSKELFLRNVFSSMYKHLERKYGRIHYSIK